jgi:hypothetical protein
MGLKPISTLFCTEEEAAPPKAGLLISRNFITFADEISCND